MLQILKNNRINDYKDLFKIDKKQDLNVIKLNNKKEEVESSSQTFNL